MFTIFEKLLRLLAAFIDGLLGWAAGELYKLIVQIANVDIFGNYIYEFMGRIYTYLAIFMLFKLSISVVNYVLNPDMLVDKSKGFGKIIQNVIIVIGLIIMTPQIFDWAYKLQSTILNTNVLYTIITGKKNESTYDPQKYANMTDDSELVAAITSDAEYAANMIKYEIMSAFIYNENNNENSAVKGKTGKTCYEFIEGGSNYRAGYDCLMSLETVNNTDNRGSKTYGFSGDFTNEYKAFISTACIGVVAYVFLVTAFDIALRCVKLGALQLMAPIPIISMLDPDSAKNGMFSKWFKECKNVYLSLFTRLIAIYFAVEIIKSMSESGRFVWRGTNTEVGFGFVKIFIILGLLMFAKQFPQFIESTFGIKMDTGGLNLKKKLESVPGLNRATAGALGYAGGAAANIIAGIQSGKKPWEIAGSALAGATSGAFRGLTSKEKSPFKAGTGAIKGAVDARNLREQRQTTGYTLGRRVSAGINTFAGLDPMAEFETELKQYDDFEKQAGNILNRASSEMIKYGDLSLSNGLTMAAHKREKERLTALENTDTSQMTSAELFRHTDELSRLRDRVNINDKKFANAYIDAVMTGKTLHKADGSPVNMGDVNDTGRDNQTVSMVQGLENTISTSSNKTINGISLRDTNGNFNGNIKGAKDSISDKKVEVTNSEGYQRALANKKAK